ILADVDLSHPLADGAIVVVADEVQDLTHDVTVGQRLDPEVTFRAAPALSFPAHGHARGPYRCRTPVLHHHRCWRVVSTRRRLPGRVDERKQRQGEKNSMGPASTGAQRDSSCRPPPEWAMADAPK